MINPNSCNKAALSHIVDKLKVPRRKSAKTGRFDVAIHHGFRKFFKTKLVETKFNIDGKLIPAISEQEQEKMMGHSNGVKGIYHDAIPKVLYLEYQKAIEDKKIATPRGSGDI